MTDDTSQPTTSRLAPAEVAHAMCHGWTIRQLTAIEFILELEDTHGTEFARSICAAVKAGRVSDLLREIAP